MTTDPETKTEPAGHVRYYTRDSDILYRSTDDRVSKIPDEVLLGGGWQPITSGGGFRGQFDPAKFPELSEVTFEEAQEVASERALPTTGWAVDD